MRKTRFLVLSLSLLLAGMNSPSTPTPSREVALHLGQGALSESVTDDHSYDRVQVGTAASSTTPPGRHIEARVNLPSVKKLMASGTPAGPSRTPAPVRKAVPRITGWRYDAHVSNYGGKDDHGMFDGRRTACGQTFGPKLLGVAHKTLPCGTRVAFRYRGKTVIVRVVDRGPYVAGRQFDLTIATAYALGHVFTGGLHYKIIGR